MKELPPAGELLTYITLVGLVAYAAIATDLYLPAIPYMIIDLGGAQADGQLTLSVFMIGLALGQLILGHYRTNSVDCRSSVLAPFYSSSHRPSVQWRRVWR